MSARGGCCWPACPGADTRADTRAGTRDGPCLGVSRRRTMFQIRASGVSCVGGCPCRPRAAPPLLYKCLPVLASRSSAGPHVSRASAAARAAAGYQPPPARARQGGPRLPTRPSQVLAVAGDGACSRSAERSQVGRWVLVVGCLASKTRPAAGGRRGSALGLPLRASRGEAGDAGGGPGRVGCCGGCGGCGLRVGGSISVVGQLARPGYRREYGPAEPSGSAGLCGSRHADALTAWRDPTQGTPRPVRGWRGPTQPSA